MIVELDSDLRLQSGLESINATLAALVSAPAQPTTQSALATALATFSAAADKLNGTLSPTQAAAIGELGGAKYFDPAIAVKVQGAVSTNAMTPSVAKDFVQDLANRRAVFLSTVKQTRAGLEELGVNGVDLEPGAVDLAFVVPRDLFRNELGSFAKELGFISRFIQDVSEALTGNVQPVELEGLSSSVPMVALVASLPVALAIGKVVNVFLDAWEKVDKIRKVRAELIALGLKGKAVEELTEQITTNISEVVEESTQLTLIAYPGEGSRKNELENAIRQDLHRLFGQIERGLTVQLRAEQSDDANTDVKLGIDEVVRLSRTLKFPKLENEPMLLRRGEILEGELTLRKITKRTTKKTEVKKTSLPIS